MSSPALAIQLSEAEMRLLQTLVYQECGMYFDARRAHFLQDRLQRRLRECRMDSFYNYYRLLMSPEGRQELMKLVENLTVNETSFFRNKAQLELFHKQILEELIAQKQESGDQQIRIWSAGCSTGQEPYTIAMLLADALAYHPLRMPGSGELEWPRPLISPPWRVESRARNGSASAPPVFSGPFLTFASGFGTLSREC